MRCQCRWQIAKLRWQDHVWNTDVSSLTGLGPVLDTIVHHRSWLFGHVARLPEETPAHQALRCHIDLSRGRLPDPSWEQVLCWQQVAWPTSQGQQHTSWWPDTSRHAWTLRGDAKVLDDYALETMTDFFLLKMLVKQWNRTIYYDDCGMHCSNLWVRESSMKIWVWNNDSRVMSLEYLMTSFSLVKVCIAVCFCSIVPSLEKNHDTTCLIIIWTLS